jgi:hypothetical protein
VVLLRAATEDALVQQGNTLLGAELQAAGFEVIVRVRDGQGDVRHDIEAASAELQPVATFAILPLADGATVELWLEDRVTGKLVIRRLRIDRSREVAGDLAVRAVELLRGSLLEVAVAPPTAAPGAADAPADVARWISAATAAEEPRHFARGVGVGLAGSALASVGLPASFAPALQLSWGAASGRFVRLTLAGLGSSGELSRAEGTAQVRQELALVEGAAVFRAGARLQPFAGAGAGAHRLRVHGSGTSSLFPGASGSTLAAAAYAGGGVALRLGRRVSLLAEAGALAVFPRTGVLIAGTEAGRAGGIAALAAVGVLATF